MPEWIVSLPDRLDAFLAQSGAVLSRSKAQQAIEAGRVTVNEQVVTKPAHRLQEGDAVVLTETDKAPDRSIEPIDLSLEILYEDAACAVINKPAGIAVHPGAGMAPGERTILHGAAFLSADWKPALFSADHILVHRLDKDTTGCLLIAKTPAAHIALQKQFETRAVDKRYQTIVAGVPSPASAVIDAPIGRSHADRTMMAVSGSGDARDSRTTYRTLGVSAAGNAALLECELHTGRTHQVRVHLASIGHPVLGDGTYGNELSERLAQEFDIRMLCLHAWKLTFESPVDRIRHAVEAPLPGSFLNVLDRLGIRAP
ncbi:MAG: 23S rRNA pseudouridine synthase [Candidatus Peregrinibacteria bacterium Greene0416_19]|nr:MAG: 23S rRNA pseudouridine synthase [Candidatus Peregrinibacteria bacterium Greene0416_19]